NALVKQYHKLFELEDVELSFTEDALQAIAQKAIKRKTGARGLRSIVEAILLDTMFDLPSMDDVSEVVVDKDVVAGRREPVRAVSVVLIGQMCRSCTAVTPGTAARKSRTAPSSIPSGTASRPIFTLARSRPHEPQPITPTISKLVKGSIHAAPVHSTSPPAIT